MAKVKARTVLWYLTFFGFAINYMIRININITIVEMIMSKTVLPANTRSTELENIKLNHSEIELNNATSLSEPNEKFSLERQFLDWANINYEPNGFNWDESQRGMALGAFFWIHWMLQLPGGILARKYGTKYIFGLSNAIGCWLCMLIPIASYWDFKAFLILRVLQGTVTGVAWPSMHVLTAKWIPPNERSKFVSAYLGSSVGVALFYPIFGYIMHYASWEWVYHICGILGTVWYLAWLYFVYDTPAEHPRIDAAERQYIEKSLGGTVTQENSNSAIPWKAILTSRPVWVSALAHFGSIWGLFTLMTQMPTYISKVHKWSIQGTGIVSGMPHLLRMAFSYIFSMYADYLLRTEKMSRTNVRKLATIICCVIFGIMVIFLAYFGNNLTFAIIFSTLSIMVQGAVSAGTLAAVVDLAPNYAGILFGFCQLIGCMPGFISPWIVGLITLDNQTFDAWKQVFLICGGILISSGVIYVSFAEANLQKWNNSNTADGNHKELQHIATTETLTADEEEQRPLKDKIHD